MHMEPADRRRRGVGHTVGPGHLPAVRGQTLGLIATVLLQLQRRVGNAAVTAVLLALSPTLITHSRFITPDMPTALLVAVAVLTTGRWSLWS